MNVETVPVGVGPLLLLGGGHADPQQVGVGVVDCLDHVQVVFHGELGLVRGRVGNYFEVGVGLGGLLANQAQYLFAGTQEHDLAALLVQLVHLEDEQVPAGNALLGLRLCVEPLAHANDADSIGNKHVALGQGLFEQNVLAGVVVRECIDRVDQKLALGQVSQFCSATKQIQVFNANHRSTPSPIPKIVVCMFFVNKVHKKTSTFLHKLL